MPKLDGFEVLELAGTDMAIVFTTAYDEYALKAFEVHAVDYLLKTVRAPSASREHCSMLASGRPSGGSIRAEIGTGCTRPGENILIAW